jgi:hypothetical protein
MRYKMKSTWNIINIEKGRTMTWSVTQYLMGKSCDQNDTETINKYFLSLSDKLVNSISSKLRSPADMDCWSSVEQAIKSEYPKLCINPVSTGETEKIIYSFKIKDPCGYDQISLKVLKLATPYISLPFNYIYIYIVLHIYIYVIQFCVHSQRH